MEMKKWKRVKQNTPIILEKGYHSVRVKNEMEFLLELVNIPEFVDIDLINWGQDSFTRSHL